MKKELTPAEIEAAREAKRQYMAEWRARNPEKVKVIAHNYYLRHREERNAKSKAWAAANKERRKETQRRWREANRDKLREAEMRRWLKKAKAQKEAAGCSE